MAPVRRHASASKVAPVAALGLLVIILVAIATSGRQRIKLYKPIDLLDVGLQLLEDFEHEIICHSGRLLSSPPTNLAGGDAGALDIGLEPGYVCFEARNIMLQRGHVSPKACHVGLQAAQTGL
jgi:hypothetical protein